MHIKKPSEAEVEILQILWERQPCSVRDVHEDISKIKDVGYTTVLKQIQRMQVKGLVSRIKGAGKSYLYLATQPQEQMQSRLLKRILKSVFGGNVNELVMQALGDAKTSSEDLEAIKAFIETIENTEDQGDKQ